MKYATYLYKRSSYRSSLKRAQLKLGQRRYEMLKTSTGGSSTLDDEPKYDIRATDRDDFHLRLEVNIYTRMLEELELEAKLGFEYERPGNPLLNKLLPQLPSDQKDIRRSDFKRYADYPRKTAVWTAIGFVILAIASIVALPFLINISVSGALVQGGVISNVTSLQWQGAIGAVWIGLCTFFLYITIEERYGKRMSKLLSNKLKRYFLGTRSMSWGQKLQTVVTFSIWSYWNLLLASCVFPGRVLLSVLFLVINQKRFKKTGDETEAFVAAWRFALTFLLTIQVCVSIAGILLGVILIVVP